MNLAVRPVTLRAEQAPRQSALQVMLTLGGQAANSSAGRSNMFPGEAMVPGLLMWLLLIIPFWKIFGKAGFNPTLSLLTIIPIANLVVIYYIAFSRWPSE